MLESGKITAKDARDVVSKARQVLPPRAYWSRAKTARVFGMPSLNK